MLTYAKVGGPPHNWMGLRIVDVCTGEEVRDVIEVNVDEGWLLRFVRDEHGDPVVKRDEFVMERIEGSFRIDELPTPAGQNN